MNKLYGVHLSPFVRKVVLVMELKGLDYKIIPAGPGMLPDGFEKINPLKKIPAFQDDSVCIPDSSVICQYLEDVYPEFKAIPSDPVLKARALWLEEFSDTKLAEVTGLELFFERFVKPFLSQETNEELVQKNLNGPMLDALRFMESVCAERTSKFLVGDSVGIADFSVVSNFLNAKYVNYEPDPVEFPLFAAYLNDMYSVEIFAKRIAAEENFVPKA